LSYLQKRAIFASDSGELVLETPAFFNPAQNSWAGPETSLVWAVFEGQTP
jgi:hypothetical protein